MEEEVAKTEQEITDLKQAMADALDTRNKEHEVFKQAARASIAWHMTCIHRDKNYIYVYVYMCICMYMYICIYVYIFCALLSLRWQ